MDGGRMIELMPRYVDHDAHEPILVWGGPEHGRTVTVEAGQTAIVFPVQRRLTVVSFSNDLDPMGPALATVLYAVDRFGFQWADGTRETWRVLVYKENYERQKQQLEVAANFVIALATGAAWTLEDWR